jgi:antitoxin component of RelBE/YafQ-DinJ toxin-antitoxin module
MATLRGLGRQLLLRTRINHSEREAFVKAAQLSGISLSAWSRMVLRKAAAADLNAAGHKIDL